MIDFLEIARTGGTLMFAVVAAVAAVWVWDGAR
jgi:hypothetical protein